MFNRKIGTISKTIHTPYEGMFGLGGTPTYIKEITGNRYIDLTNAIANKLLELKAYGGTEQSGTPTTTTPVDIVSNNGVLKVNSQGQIYADGTTETIEVHSKNLYNPATAQEGYLTDTGGFTPSVQGATSDFIQVKPSTTYTLKFTRTAQEIYTRVCSYSGASESDFLTLLVKNTSVAAGDITSTFTTDATAHYIRISFKIDSTNVQLEEGSTATTYEPYYYGGTATAEMLLKVGDYKDTQEILSGTVTRNCKIYVFNGTENWFTWSTLGYFCDFVNAGAKSSVKVLSTVSNNWNFTSSNRLLCNISQATFPTLEDWTNYLKDQYQAGTPVIMVYALATPTTESVAGQTMDIQEGNNTIEIAQSAIDNLGLYAKYESSQQ